LFGLLAVGKQQRHRGGCDPCPDIVGTRG
jgi:hypothetical protein